MKSNFEIVDKYITEENFNSLCEYKFIPKEIQSQLTNFIANDFKNILQIELNFISFIG